MILEAAFAVAIDGDTLDLNGSRVRLWGINSPELSTGNKGKEAKVALQTLLKNGVVCHVWTRDRYGRYVGQCYVKGEDVAWHLIAGGWAEDWPKYSKGYYHAR